MHPCRSLCRCSMGALDMQAQWMCTKCRGVPHRENKAFLHEGGCPLELQLPLKCPLPAKRRQSFRVKNGGQRLIVDTTYIAQEHAAKPLFIAKDRFRLPVARETDYRK